MYVKSTCKKATTTALRAAIIGDRINMSTATKATITTGHYRIDNEATTTTLHMIELLNG